MEGGRGGKGGGFSSSPSARRHLEGGSPVRVDGAQQRNDQNQKKTKGGGRGGAEVGTSNEQKVKVHNLPSK